MKLKEYFDVSSIHGLGHINSQRWFGKIFWFLVVLGGFVVAGILLQQSFEDWRDNPISTVIETEPILKSKFPDFVVCPPKNTFTNLNLDLMNAEKITLNNEMRESLINLTTEMILDEEFFDVYENENEVFLTNKFKNWYTGFLSATLSTAQVVEVSTSSEAGLFSSPFYGDSVFRADKFHIQADYAIRINPPKNISRYRKGRGYDNLCVKIQKDTSKWKQERSESVTWYQGFRYGQLDEDLKTETQCFKGKDFKKGGRFGFVRVLFDREITERAFEGWSKKRFTGMNVSWYYTDSEGKNIDIVPQPIHINEEGNIQLITLTKLVKNHPNKDLWRKLKQFRTETVDNVNVNEIQNSCKMSVESNVYTMLRMEPISVFLDGIIKELGMENETKTLSLDLIDDSTLQVASAMFIYLTKCPTHSTLTYIKQIKQFFKMASSVTIWETLINVYKNSLVKSPKNINFSIDAIENMILHVGEAIKSSLAILEALSLSEKEMEKSVNKNILIKSMPKETLKCVKNITFCQNSSFNEDISDIHKMVTHPVHINNATLSSFIPFCSLGGKMSVVGKKFSDFPVPVCSSFKPFMMDNQVCMYIFMCGVFLFCFH